MYWTPYVAEFFSSFLSTGWVWLMIDWMFSMFRSECQREWRNKKTLRRKKSSRGLPARNVCALNATTSLSFSFFCSYRLVYVHGPETEKEMQKRLKPLDKLLEDYETKNMKEENLGYHKQRNRTVRIVRRDLASLRLWYISIRCRMFFLQKENRCTDVWSKDQKTNLKINNLKLLYYETRMFVR